MVRTFSQSKYCEELIKDSGKGKGQKPLLEIGTSVENVKLDSNFQYYKTGDKTMSKINDHSYPSLSSIYKVWFY